MAEQYEILGDEFSKTDGIKLQLGTDGRALCTLPLQQGFGIVSRPLPSSPEAAARVLVSDGVAHAGTDERGLELVQKLKPGETAIYAPGGKGRIVLKLDGTIALVSESPEGNTSLVQIGPTGFDVAFNSARLHLDTEAFSVANSSGLFAISGGAIKIMSRAIQALGKFSWNSVSGNSTIQATPPAVDLSSAITGINSILLYLKGLL
jgi:phage gp45-like